MYDAGSESIEKKYRRVWWKTKLGCRAEQMKRYHDQIFEEMMELEEKKSEEVLLLDDLWRDQNERDAEIWKLERSEKGDGLVEPSLF